MSNARTGVLLAALLLQVGCVKQARTPPPGFLQGAPVITGNEELDRRVADARRLATMDGAELDDLHRVAVSGKGGDRAVSDLTMALLARGRGADALTAVERWVEINGHSDRAMATYLDLALGTGQSERCAVALGEFLEIYPEHPFLHIARGVCLNRLDQGNAASYAFFSGMQRIATIGGFTGTLDRELGLGPSSAPLPADRVARERLELMKWLLQESPVGHTALWHHLGFTEDATLPDPRLLFMGGVTVGDLDQVFASRREVYRHCQLIHAKRRKVPGGRLLILVTIQRDGSPGEVERVHSTFESEEVVSCLENQAMNLWFPQPRYSKGLKYEREFRMVGD